MRFVWIFSVTKHDQIFMNRQNGCSARVVTICYLCSANGRKNSMFQEASVFDSCNLNNVKVYLNSDFYPYDDLNLNFENFKKRYTILFNMYMRFRKTLRNRLLWNIAQRALVCWERTFCDHWLLATKWIRQESVNVRTEFDCKENVLVDTIAYFLIIHDRIVQSVNQRCKIILNTYSNTL